jgi:GUN4-like/Caspase domain
MRLPDPERSNAVLVGVSTYRNRKELPPLPTVANNVTALARALTHPQTGSLSPERCVVLRDPVNPRSLYETLKPIARNTEDTLLVYFAGHGSIGLRNELYLDLMDTDPDPEALQFSAMPFAALNDLFQDSRAANRILILDCCFSGRAIKDMAGSATEPILDVTGTYTLTSTSANARALAPAGERYTAFTGELLKLLRDGLPGEPELLTMDRLYTWLRHNLSKRSLPTPKQRGVDSTAVRLALTRNPAFRSAEDKAEAASVPPTPAKHLAEPFDRRSEYSVSLGHLDDHLQRGEFEQADLLTTTLVLKAAGRREDGWISTVAAKRLPLELLDDIDARWSARSDRQQGFRAQSKLTQSAAQPDDDRYERFPALAAAFGWQVSANDAGPFRRYRKFVERGVRSNRAGFFPTLYNPGNEHLREWYDLWFTTVLAVHGRLADRSVPWDG